MSERNAPDSPWNPRPQRVRGSLVGNRGAVRVPVRAPSYASGRPDLKHNRTILRTGPSTPVKRKISPLPANHPCISNRMYNPVTRRTLYIPSKLDYDYETDQELAELNRLMEIKNRNGKNEILSKLIQDAKKKVKKAQNNAIAAGNFYINGIHYEKFYKHDEFPNPEDLILVSTIPNE
jgi:hypothetical protein